MAEVETEPIPQLSIQARIAALKLDQVGKNPATKQPPPLPNKPSANRANSAVVLPTIGDGVGNEPNGDALPPLPQRRNKPPPPSLPPRRDNETSSLPVRRPSELDRRPSQESISSVISSVSAISNGTARTSHSRPSMDGGRIRAPVYDASTLPPLPPTRRGLAKEVNGNVNGMDIISKTISPKIPAIVSSEELPPVPNINRPVILPRPGNPVSPALPSRPNGVTSPVLPTRPASANSRSATIPVPPQRPQANEPPLPARRVPPTTIPPASECSPRLPQRSPNQVNGNGMPPPIPTSTRPDLGKLMATKPTSQASLPVQPVQPVTAVLPSRLLPTSNSNESQDVCLQCRDFSGPDQHAAKFPRQDVPYMGWLAEQLTAPFPSQTDKARAIFAWLHHNIAYDVDAFFGKRVKHVTPAETIESGLAVCGGYAGLFAALATAAGMEAVVLVGHGKGIGFTPLKAGEACPPKDFNHAWNAVKIDGGEWKLCDPCWGAGYVCTQKYVKKWNPSEFIMTNEEFGLKHYPNDSKYWYRMDGKIPTWEEYYAGNAIGEPVTIYGDLGEGFSRASVSPKQLYVSCNPGAHAGPTVRFQFERICTHWDPIKLGKGKPFLYVLQTGEGSNKQFLPFENDGMYWWADISVRKIGRPGDDIIVLVVDTVGGHSAQGITKEEYLAAHGRKAMSWKYAAKWQVVA